MFSVPRAPLGLGCALGAGPAVVWRLVLAVIVNIIYELCKCERSVSFQWALEKTRSESHAVGMVAQGLLTQTV